MESVVLALVVALALRVVVAVAVVAVGKILRFVPQSLYLSSHGMVSVMMMIEMTMLLHCGAQWVLDSLQSQHQQPS